MNEFKIDNTPLNFTKIRDVKRDHKINHIKHVKSEFHNSSKYTVTSFFKPISKIIKPNKVDSENI